MTPPTANASQLVKASLLVGLGRTWFQIHSTHPSKIVATGLQTEKASQPTLMMTVVIDSFLRITEKIHASAQSTYVTVTMTLTVCGESGPSMGHLLIEN